MADLPLPDSGARERAVDPARSFIVQAPAGSGKTELLVRRYVRLLAMVQQPEEILAITFTIKAAAEMRQRVLEKLPNARDIGHRLRIQTIDALCASLTARMPVTSRFGAQPQLVEDATAHYRDAASRTLGDLNPWVERLLGHLDNNVAAAGGLLATMLARRDQWLRKTGNPPSREALEKNLALERTRLLEAARALDPRASEEFAAEVLTKEGTWRKRSATAQALAGNEPLRLALCKLLAVPPAEYTDYQWEVLEAMMKLLPLAAAHLKVLFGERREADFTEVAQGALRALGTPDAPTDLLLAFDYRVKHILVDEFQDTSISQWELLSLLTSEWTPEEGRTLFLVGDPMQSIYRFREAEVALFLHARTHGLGQVALEPLTLSTNFRSQKNLIGFFNAAFAEIFPKAADEASGSVPYSPAAPHPESAPLPGEAVTWHALPDRAAEATRVVELVRKAKDRTAILVRSRDALAAIVPALKKEGIRFRAIEIEHLGEKQVVQDLYALTRALSHLADRIAWLSILRAPWCGLSLSELHAIAGADRFATIWELIQENRNLQRFRDVMAPAIANRARGTLRERVEGVWLALGGPACVQSETDLEDAEIFLDTLERLEHAGDLDDPAALEEALKKLYALPDMEATDDDLQIMTIHKAKGLEFGTVIVPALDKAPGRIDSPLFLWRELALGGGLLLAPIKETGADDDPAYRYLRDLDLEADDLESSRLLYVAATRAEHRLHLLACTKCDDAGTVKRPASRSLLARAWPVAEPHFAAQVPPQLEIPFAPTPRPAFTTLTRLATDLHRIAPPAPVRWTPPPEARDEQAIEFSWAGETARHIGTIVHRWLQRIAEDELRGWDATRIRALLPHLSRELARRGVPSTDAARSAELVATALINSVTDERGRWLLGPSTNARDEYRIRGVIDGLPRTFVIDRLLRDKSNVEWIVDYKTSRHEGADVEAFLDRERDRYAPQLRAYGKLRKDSRQGLFFPLLRGWRQL
jgi:ATP-dependent helicase/nuclease subunit A